MAIKQHNHSIQKAAQQSAKSSETSSSDVLRPRFLQDMVGREREKKVMKMLINSVLQQRQHSKEVISLDHILFYGPPGLGKTTFAYVMAQELGVHLRITSGPAIEKQGDLVAILTNLKPGDILFIDEIHRLRRNIEEVLYPAMEERKVDIIIGQGPSAQSVRLHLAPFTLLGATTRLGLLSGPLRDRFGVLQHLDYYAPEELATMVERIAQREGVSLTPEAAQLIGERARGTARLAVRLYKRTKDYARSLPAKTETLVPEHVIQTAEVLGIDKLGLDPLDRKILHLIVDRFNGGPVGLGTLASALSEDADTIADVYEPFLLQLGFVKRTPRGRITTEKALEHLSVNS